MKKIDGWVTTPQGFLAAGVKAGIKASGNHDIAVIYSTVRGTCIGKPQGCRKILCAGYCGKQRLR